VDVSEWDKRDHQVGKALENGGWEERRIGESEEGRLWRLWRKDTRSPHRYQFERVVSTNLINTLALVSWIGDSRRERADR
jgi:hypothetical protein